MLPKIQSKFYTRSALVKSLIPKPSEGKVRAKFAEASPVRLPLVPKYSPFSDKKKFGKSGFSVDTLRQKVEEEESRNGRLLDMVNKVQMFQIAVSKINKNLESRKMNPIFKLRADAAPNNNTAH
jgi:hypothetical protein